MLTIASLKSHVETFVSKELAAADVSFHTTVRRFAEFVEGKEAEADAINLLTEHGYTVSPPSAPASTLN